MTVGIETTIPPIPPIEANTRRIDAGAVSFGVEFRLLDAALAAAHLEANAEQASREGRGVEVVDTSGVSIHVFGADGHEYLRFDCFDDDPHYHYISPTSQAQRIVGLDVAALGAPLDFSLACLRQRLPNMLHEAGGAKVAQALDRASVATALDRVEAAAREITKAA